MAADLPIPALQVQPFSGLDFPWAEKIGSRSESDASLGGDGVALGMTIIIFWRDLEPAIQQLLGYSYRDTTGPVIAGGPIGPVLKRKLPWQHPFWNQLWVKNISKVQGLKMSGKAPANLIDTIAPTEGGAGAGFTPNRGPWTEWTYALLTLHFWRPPYYVRTNDDIKNASSFQQEWLRYTDKTWSVNVEMLSRENSAYTWVPGQGTETVDAATGLIIAGGFSGSVGQKVIKTTLSKKWYQVPEAALFKPWADATPNGIPKNMMYTQTATTNPITGYVYPVGSPLLGCVNAPINGDPWNGFYASSVPLANRSPANLDTVVGNQFFGFKMGTLLFVGVEFHPVPLQMPAYLMQIPFFAMNEAISQVQYDVVFHYEYFDPPTSPTGAGANGLNVYGHNLYPFSRNGLWYAARSKGGADGSKPAGPNQAQTPLQYADMTDAWVIV